MSASVHRTSKSGGRSRFFQDLATPVSSRRSTGKFTTPGQAATVSALWHENFANSDLPPPPVFTLEDRSDFSPESGIPDYPVSPEIKSDPRTPVQSTGREFSTPMSKSEASTSYAVTVKQQHSQQSPVLSSSWWSPAKSVGSAERDDKGKGSPVEGVIQPGALITLPPSSDIQRPEMKKNSVPASNLDEKEWVTVYGGNLLSPSRNQIRNQYNYSFKEAFLNFIKLLAEKLEDLFGKFLPGDTNLVLREFEKCGVILKHVPGPRGANWIHILYQNRSDAKKALSKNGMQINGVLIIGVKPVDPIQRQALNERLHNQGFLPIPPAPSSRNLESNGFNVTPHSYSLQNGSSIARQSGGTVAVPAKSAMSKIMDLIYGV